MANPTIDNIRAIGDFALSYRWNLSFSAFPSIGTWPSSDDLNIRCETSELPSAQVQSTSIMIRGHKVKQHGLLAYKNTLSFGFAETVDNKISNLLKQWRDIIWTPQTGVSNQKSQVTAQILLQRLDNQNNPIWQYTLIGCYLEGYDAGGTLAGSTADIVKPSLQISYDYFLDGAVSK